MKKQKQTKTVTFGQLTAAERVLDEIVAFAHDELFRVVRIDSAKKLVHLERVIPKEPNAPQG